MIGPATSWGSRCNACGEVAASAGAPLRAIAAGRRSSRKFANSDPKIAAPNELPMVRKNVTPEVATPRSVKSTVFCTTSTSTCMLMPMPAPSTSRYSDSTSVDVSASMRESSTKPSAMVAVPAIGKIL